MWGIGFIAFAAANQNSKSFDPILMMSFIIGGICVLSAWSLTAVRRLQDTGRHWTTMMLVAIPYLGGIILLILLFLRGHDKDNAYGPSPYADKGTGA